MNLWRIKIPWSRRKHPYDTWAPFQNDIGDWVYHNMFIHNVNDICCKTIMIGIRTINTWNHSNNKYIHIQVAFNTFFKNNSHWILITIHVPLLVYITQIKTKLPRDTILLLTNLINVKNIEYTYVNIMQQTNGSSCGILYINTNCVSVCLSVCVSHMTILQ